jgi:hypothetical protein
MPKKNIAPAKLNSIENINDALIKACIRSRPSLFKPYLLSEKVSTDCSDKDIFYKFFKRMLAFSKKASMGELHFKLNPASPDSNFEIYEFHDNFHVHARLSIIVKKSEDTFYIDVLPF